MFNILCTVSPFAKNRAIFCGNSVWEFPKHQTAGAYIGSTPPGLMNRNRGTRIKKNMTTPMAAMMRPIKRPWGCFFGVAFLGYLSSCYPKDPWDDLTYIYLHFSLHGSKGRSRYRKDGS